MVPLVKFGLFDSDLTSSIQEVKENVLRVSTHLNKWEEFLEKKDFRRHSVGISHTDQDMLTITFQVKFSRPIPLEKNSLADELAATLDLLMESSLL